MQTLEPAHEVDLTRPCDRFYKSIFCTAANNANVFFGSQHGSSQFTLGGLEKWQRFLLLNSSTLPAPLSEERVIHQHVEQVREVPVPMVQEGPVSVDAVGGWGNRGRGGPCRKPNVEW